MAITKLISVTTRPENTLWFNQVEPEKIKQLTSWTKEYPGLLSVSGKQLDIVTWQNVYEFESKERCDQFLSDRANHPIQIERTAYMANYNQVVVNSVES
jgi:hypothetical protein